MKDDESIPATTNRGNQTRRRRVVSWLTVGAAAAVLELAADNLAGHVGHVWYNPFTWHDPPVVGTSADGNWFRLPDSESVPPRRAPVLVTAAKLGNQTNQPASVK